MGAGSEVTSGQSRWRVVSVDKPANSRGTVTLIKIS